MRIIKEGAWNEIQGFLKDHPHIKYRLLIDRSHQEVSEERLPPLSWGDLLRFKLQKQRECKPFGSFHIFEDHQTRYLQFVHIHQDDPLIPFILKAKGGVYFVSLEGNRFASESSLYRILTYPLSDGHERQTVYKGKRMLLSRVTYKGEDIRKSLDFLSRTYPDIYEMFHVKHLEKIEFLIDFITQQKSPLLPFKTKVKDRIWWLKRLILFMVSLNLIEIGVGFFFLYQKPQPLPGFQNMDSLEKNRLSRETLEHYLFLKSLYPDSLKTIHDLSSLLIKTNSRLLEYSWSKGKELSLRVIFLNEKDANGDFETLILSLKKMFPHAQLELLETPYQSSSRELYTGIKGKSPLASLRIGVP
jgi:hypothetical protein